MKLTWDDQCHTWTAHSTGNQVRRVNMNNRFCWIQAPTQRLTLPLPLLQISSRLLSMRSADALLCLPQAEGSLPAGEFVKALLIHHLN